MVNISVNECNILFVSFSVPECSGINIPTVRKARTLKSFAKHPSKDF